VGLISAGVSVGMMTYNQMETQNCITASTGDYLKTASLSFATGFVSGTVGAVTGGITSSLTGSVFTSATAKYAVNFGLETLGDAFVQKVTTGEVNWKQAVISGALDTVIGAFVDGVTAIVKNWDSVKTASKSFIANEDGYIQIGKGGTSTIKYNEVKTFTAEETNQWFIDNVKPDYKPPYKPGTIVKEIELTENTTFVRVYDNMPDGSGMYGSWVMKAKDIKGLTPLEIQNKFALPNTPKYVCDVELKAGTHIRVGEVNPLEGWGSGGGTQYDLIGQRIGNFKNERFLEGN